ncbi:hypothetical protein [Vibrio phage CKB-S2]|nr:hypothetical protein [Vibrio phage CKB-S2]
MGNLPQYCHKHDREWIRQQLGKLPHHWREQVAKVYSDKYKEIYYSEHESPKSENRARNAANAWLRGYVTKYINRKFSKVNVKHN